MPRARGLSRSGFEEAAFSPFPCLLLGESLHLPLSGNAVPCAAYLDDGPMLGSSEMDLKVLCGFKAF